MKPQSALLALALLAVCLTTLAQRPTEIGTGGGGGSADGGSGASPSPAVTPPAPTSPPPSGGGGGSGQCVIVPQANAEGDLLRSVDGVATVAACCTLCQNESGCNVFVYCAVDKGCDNGVGQIYPAKSCYLKTQALQPGQEPKYFAQGSVVQWQSGYIPT